MRFMPQMGRPFNLLTLVFSLCVFWGGAILFAPGKVAADSFAYEIAESNSPYAGEIVIRYFDDVPRDVYVFCPQSNLQVVPPGYNYAFYQSCDNPGSRIIIDSTAPGGLEHSGAEGSWFVVRQRGGPGGVFENLTLGADPGPDDGYSTEIGIQNWELFEDNIDNTIDRAIMRMARSADASEEAGDCVAEGPFGWMVCGILSALGGAMDAIKDNIIDPFLVISPLNTHDDADEETPTFAAWKNMRTVANVLLVPIFLVIIFAQALSLNIDAYTIKKTLPRLIAATLVIQFSYYIAAIMVDITNVIGLGLGELITNTVAGERLGVGTRSFLGVGLGIIGGGAVAGVAGVTTLAGLITLIAAGGWPIAVAALLLIVIPAFLAILGVFFTLVLRQLLIIFLVILAPIAFLAWVLPNTEKVFKMWWGTFIKLLMMFPLITLLFAAGVVLSRIGVGMVDGLFAAMLGLAALITPLFLIPLTFKMAGGLISGFAEGFNKFGKQIFYGKDGKGGLTKRMREDIDGAKKTHAAAPVWQEPDRNRALNAVGRMGSWWARPGIGGASKAMSVAEAGIAIEEKGKKLEQLGFSQRQALAYGSRENIEASKRDEALRAINNGDQQRADDILNQELPALLEAWGSVEPLAKDRGNVLAAMSTMADAGLANEHMFRAASELTAGNEDLQRAVVGGAAHKMYTKGSPSYLRFNDGVGNDWNHVERLAKNMTPEALAGMKDDLRRVAEGGNQHGEVLRDIFLREINNNPTMAVTFRQALNIPGISTATRNNIVSVLGEAGHDTTPLETTVDVTRAQGTPVRQPTQDGVPVELPPEGNP